MADLPPALRTLALSVVKHAYVPDAIAAHPRFQLVGVADDGGRPAWTHQRNAAYAAAHGVPYVRGVERAIAELRPEVAVISSEAERHCELAVRAARAGLHLVVDKPLSPCVRDCDAVVAAVQTSGVQSLVWNRNFLPALVQAKSAVDGGAIGGLRAIHCDFYFAKDAGPRIGSRAPGDPPLDWLKLQLEAHADGADGGVGARPLGELQIEGFYPLAFVHLLTGARVERVFARTATCFHQVNADHGVEDLASVTLRLSDGGVGSLCLGRIGAASHPDIGEIKLHLLGDAGAMVVAEARPEVAAYFRGQAETEFRHERVANRNDFLLAEAFADAVELGQAARSMIDVVVARDIARTVDAALRSAASGRWEETGPGRDVRGQTDL